MTGKLRTFACGALAVVLVCLAVVCLFSRGAEAGYSREVMFAAAALTMPDGSLSRGRAYNNNTSETLAESTSQVLTNTIEQSSYDEAVYSEDPEIYEDEAHFPVVETMYSTGQIGFNNFFLKNTTGLSIDIGEYLERPLGFEFEDSQKVQVLVVHTHTTESYLTYDAGYYHESFYPRSNESDRNMLRVGKAIVEGLRKNGIGAVHATQVHDYPEYDGAYYRSFDTINKYIEKYPDIKVVLDIHRDSISYGSEGGKVKPTFTYDGRKAAQIMIMAGCDQDGTMNFPFWEDNLSFALKLQDTAENMYPGMTRPLYFGNFVYNMDANNGSLLIEMGTDANTLSEAVYTGELLANVLSKVLQSG